MEPPSVMSGAAARATAIREYTLMSWASAKSARLVSRKSFLDGVGGGEGDGVNDGVDDGEGFRDLREGGVDLLVGGDVKLDGAAAACLAQRLQKVFGLFFQALGLVAEDERGAGIGEGFGDGVGDAAFVGDAEHDGDLTLHGDHSSSPARRRIAGRFGPDRGWSVFRPAAGEAGPSPSLRSGSG